MPQLGRIHWMRGEPKRKGNTLLMSLVCLGERVGTCIGLNAAFLNIITEWVSDIKQGHCTTAWYLNENFCCWGAGHGVCNFFPPSRHATHYISLLPKTNEPEYLCFFLPHLFLFLAGCTEWKTWTSFGPANYLIYILFSVWVYPPPSLFSMRFRASPSKPKN